MKKHLKPAIGAMIAALTLATLCFAYTGVPNVVAHDDDEDDDGSRTKLTFDLTLVGPSPCDPAFGELATWQGTVRRDIEGDLRARLRGLPLTLGGEAVPVQFDWIVSAGGLSFKARLEGSWNFKTGKLEMNGTVTEGFRSGESARVKGNLFDFRNLRFKGDMRIGGNH
jgi:hypothetical protein